jgi:polyferredoxin
LESRWLLFIARAITLAGFVFTILAGLFGSPVGSHNFAIIFVWLAWWTALKLVFIPLGGRSWCSVCPLPMPGEWLQRGGLVTRSQKRRGLSLRWPRRLRGYWIQAGLFLAIGTFSAVTLTDARVTAWILLGLIGLAIVLSLVFENRAFCANVCPIGGFTGMYSQMSPIELRVRDASVCVMHGEKTCYQECPWGVYPLALKNNSACGLCMECLRVCPQDNLALNLRPFGSDVGTPRRSQRLDEAFLALVMLGSALAFSAVFTGPWGGLKSAAYAIGSPMWAAYAAGFLGLNLILLPVIYGLAVGVGQKSWKGWAALRRSMANFAQVLLPLGLFAWIAFTISFALPKLATILNVLSDPLGWGWNLFGTADSVLNTATWTFGPLLQVVALVIGLSWSIHLITRLAGETSANPVWRQAVPLMVFNLAYMVGMLWLLVG